MRLVSSGLLVMLSIYGHSQVLPSFKSLRYDEDYSMSKSDTTIPWYRKMKYKSLSKKTNTYLSMGGELRYQYFYIRNENWGVAPEDKDGFVLTRFLAHADLHVNKHFRFLRAVTGKWCGWKRIWRQPCR